MALTNSTTAAVGAGEHGPAVTAALESLLVMLSPIAPHVAEELWHRLGHEPFVASAQWPTFDPALLVEDTKRIAVQVNGKMRDTIDVATGIDQAQAEKIALERDNVARHVADLEVVKVIWVPDRLLNFVVR